MMLTRAPTSNEVRHQPLVGERRAHGHARSLGQRNLRICSPSMSVGCDSVGDQMLRGSGSTPDNRFSARLRSAQRTKRTFRSPSSYRVGRSADAVEHEEVAPVLDQPFRVTPVDDALAMHAHGHWRTEVLNRDGVGIAEHRHKRTATDTSRHCEAKVGGGCRQCAAFGDFLSQPRYWRDVGRLRRRPARAWLVPRRFCS